MESKIHLQEAINKHCILTGESEDQIKIKLKQAWWPDSIDINQDQYLEHVLKGRRKSLRPVEYNTICRVLKGCSRYLLDKGIDRN